MGNMKANRKFKNDEAVSAVIGVILMVAITVAIAATVYVYVSGMLGGGPQSAATVSMVQQGSAVLIQKVENGPVMNATCSISVVNQTSSLPDGSGRIWDYAGGDDTKVEGGDVIEIYGYSGDSGDRYTVQLIYQGNSIGSCVYIVP
jgi:flagellin-like protein